MKKYIIVEKTLLSLALILMCLFIYLCSDDNGTVSSEQSTKVTDVVTVVVDKIIDEMEIDIEQSDKLSDNLEFTIRKIAHISEFFILCIISFLFFYNKKFKLFSFIKAFSFSVFYAATDEIHQLFVDGRAGLFIDVCIDTLGVTAAILLIWSIINKKKKHLLKSFI